MEIELQSGLLGIAPSAGKVFHRKGYYSAARDADIVTDVSLEVYRPGSTEPFLIWIWECKDYGHRVPVDDVEEFQKKMEQIGPSRTKGTVVARSGFQKGAINVARSWGIGLVRLSPDGTLMRLLESAAWDPAADVEEGLTTLGPPGSLCYAVTGSGFAVHDFSRYVREEFENI
ncbi:MAG TPA: restriction endonuclease [Longimicrobium sp.]